jgi:putative transposase
MNLLVTASARHTRANAGVEKSNGMAEAFVKTFKRDYVRVNPIPDAITALTLIDNWTEDYNTVRPHSRLGYRSPREYIKDQSQPAACPA